jgi:hypothetical protein
MPRGRGRGWSGGVVVALLALLHQDLWFAGSSERVLSLPVSLLYHLGYCVAAALVMAWLWRRFGPEGEL